MDRPPGGDSGDGRRAESAHLERHIRALEERIRTLEEQNSTLLARERGAQNQAQLLQLILDQLPFALYAKDREGRFMLANAACETMYGMPPEELVGKLQSETHVDPAQAERILRSDLQVIDGLEFFERPGYPFWLPDGQLRRLDMTKLRLTGPMFPDAAVLVIARDVTDELSAERQTTQQERFVALGHLIANVAHDLRSPLASIAASVVLLKRLTDSAEPALLKILERVERSISRCDAIVGDLLNFSREGGMSMESTEVEPWIRSVLDELRINFPIVLECQLCLDGISVEFDRQRMTRALLNVLTNACEAMEDSDRGRRGERCVLTVRARSENNRLVMIVEDTGPGIPEALRNRITSPLFSSKSYGVGLGLIIVQDVIARHGGGLAIDSTFGEGTRVTLWLPAPRNPAESTR